MNLKRLYGCFDRSTTTGVSYLDPSTWRAAGPKELLDSLPKSGREHERHGRHRGKKQKRKRGLLVFRELLSPLDVYTYLKARFGEPNGFQSIMIHKMKLVRDDSDRLFHWDYLLKAGDKNLTITGATREVHVMVDVDFSDDDWLAFADNLKADFAKYGKEKSAVTKKLEKWYVFPNRFKAIANRCAEIYDDLERVVEELRAGIPPAPLYRTKKAFEVWGRKRCELTNRLVNACVQLTVLTPIMFESFIGLITALLLRPEVRANRRLSEAFKRSPLDVKIYDLASRCVGFERSIADSNPAMRSYWTVVNERNDIVHGNVDPVRDAVEVVYFEGKAPLFPRGGDALDEYFQSLVRQYEPERVLKNYQLAHELIAEILNHMGTATRDTIVGVMDNMQPGWDENRTRIGRLFPDHVVTFQFEGVRYDTDILRSRRKSAT